MQQLYTGFARNVPPWNITLVRQATLELILNSKKSCQQKPLPWMKKTLEWQNTKNYLFLHLPRGLVHGDSSWRDLSHKILPKLKNIHCYWQWPFLTWQCRNVSFFVYVMSSLGGFFWGPKSLRLKHGRVCFTTKGCWVGLVELLFLLVINGTIMTYMWQYMKYTIYSNILFSMLLVDPEHPGKYQLYTQNKKKTNIKSIN